MYIWTDSQIISDVEKVEVFAFSQNLEWKFRFKFLDDFLQKYFRFSYRVFLPSIHAPYSTPEQVSAYVGESLSGGTEERKEIRKLGGK